MNPLQDALAALSLFFDGEGVPYMAIGGIASLIWGVQRATFDVDITVWAAAREEELTGRLCKTFVSRVPAPAEFLRETRVLPILVGDIPADIVFGQLPYEEAALERAAKVPLGGRVVRVCTPEDLILHKIISERPKDMQDVRELARLRGAKLDRDYLDVRVKALAYDLGRPAIWEGYLACF